MQRNALCSIVQNVLKHHSIQYPLEFLHKKNTVDDLNLRCCTCKTQNGIVTICCAVLYCALSVVDPKHL